MAEASPTPIRSLRSCARLAVFAQGLLLLAGLRHHLVWGESARWPWLLPLLHAGEAACLVGFVALGGLAWWRGAAAAAAATPSTRQLWRLTLPILLAAVCVPPFLTADPIDYVVRGRLLAVHGQNPYIAVANDFPDDPFTSFGDAGWKHMPLPYGPVIANLQAAAAWLAHLLPVSPRLELIAALAVLKIVFAGALLCAVRLLSGVAARLGRDPAHTFVLLAWNPLLLCECIANAHNEALLVALLAWAIAAAIAGRHGSGAFAVGLGAMTKVVPILLAPLWTVLAARQRGLAALAGGVAATAALAALFWWQFFTDPAAFGVARRQHELAGASVAWAAHQATGVAIGPLNTAGRIAVVVWVAGCSVRLWRRPEPAQIVAAACSSLALLAILGGQLFGVWYHAWWLPLALLGGRGFWFRCAAVASVTGPLGYVVWAGWRRLDAPSQAAIVGFAIIVPLLIALLWRDPRR